MEMKPDEKILVQKLAANIRKYRAIKKLTQEQLAEAADSCQQHICMIEKGIVNPRIVTVSKIAEVFGVTVDELISDP